MQLRDLWGALWRQRGLVAVVLVATALVVPLGLSVAPKTYTSTATVNASGVASDVSGDLAAQRGTLAARVNSREVVAQVRARLDVDRPLDDLRREITGSATTSSLVEVTVQDADSRLAAEIADVTVDVLISAGAATGPFVLTRGSTAVQPVVYSSPDILLAILAGAVVGLTAAACGALVRDRRTRTVDDAATVERAAGAPLLAHVVAPADPTSLPAMDLSTGAGGVFRVLRRALDDADQHGGPVVVAGLNAGPASADVTVWLGANLAISLAETGARVLLVDGRLGEDHGRPLQEEPGTAGLAEVLGGVDLHDAISPGPTDGLSVLPAGGGAGRSAGFPVTADFATVVERARRDHDVVVVLAASLEHDDSALLMAAGGSLLLTVPEGAVSVLGLRTHADRARAAGVDLIGAVLVTPVPEPVPT